MVGKMPNITWLEGTFGDTIKGWQSGWFYITEPRDPEWAALNISAFIVVCEAFLRIKPHFGLWLKTFNVKPKVVSGR